MSRAVSVASLLVAFATLLAVSVEAGDPNYMNVLGYRANLRLKPFTMIPQPNYYVIDGATVSIESGYVPNHDRLFVDYQGEYPINGTFYKDIGVLKMKGKAPISEYASAISTIVFFTTSEDGNERQITFTFGNNTLFFSSTRHFYKFVHMPTVAWTTAKSECESMSFMGLKGYLATITTAEEMSNLGAKVEERAWIGANRVGDTWFWSSGPEANRSFWKGPSIYRGGAPFPSTAYSNWARFQPDNGSTSDAREQLYANVMPSLGTGVSFFEDSSNLNSVTGYICEFGGLDGKEIEQSYSLYTESVLLTLSCNLYNSSTECINHESLGCVWKGTTCGNSACSTLTTQSQCVANWMCQWNTDDNVGSCVSTPCATLPRDPCSTTPTCTYSRTDGASRCRPGRCFEKGNSWHCAKMPGCEWREGCTNGATVDCSGMDIVYLIDGADVMSEAYGKYTSGFFALTQSLLDADLGLTKTNGSAPATGFGQRVGVVQWGPLRQPLVSPSGFGSGGRITGSHSEWEADLKWQQSVYSASLTVSTIYPGLEAASKMFTDSSRKRIVVVFASREIDDAKGEKVKAAVKKLTDAGVKILGVSLRPTSSQSTRTMDADESLSQITSTRMSVTMDEVLPRVVYGLCSVADGTAGKLIETTENLELDCNDHTDFEKCDADPHCSWNYADKSCGNAMCLVLEKSKCNNNPACDWSDDKKRCLERCPAIKDQNACKSDASCTWRGDAKTPYCDSVDCIANVEESVCIAEGGCSFLPKEPNSHTFLCKATPCQFTNFNECSKTEECHWENGVCQINTCKNVHQNLCGSSEQPQCMWDDAAKACVFNECGRYNGESSCNEDLRCQWNTLIAPARCTIRPCQDKASTTSKESCEKNPACVWANTGAAVTCTLRECEMNENSADCAAMSSTCVWRNGQCKTSRFVQCPATDVVFLFEATPFSQLAFGRHPSGFSGALEKLRSWVRKAPLSEDQGFRLAAYGYGANKSALTGKGDHGGFFVNVSTFSGAGGHLSRMGEALKEYLPNVGEHDAAITPALTKAKDLFSTQSPANRKKILVIIGAQPITDGASSASLDSDIVALEKSGVSIFTIVLRRFTELSKIEKDAAAFLGPIATDPITSHFRYSSIDDLETDVLNTFCDPSTIFGKALSVSRDGTLPCSWLESKGECSVQPSCFYNSTAKAVCPLDNQCPNMGCRTLPPSIAQYFNCEDCQLVSGTFECSKGNPNPTPSGQCQVHPCLSKSQSECEQGESSQCTWNSASSRCERIMCTATDSQTCNKDIGCVFADESLAEATGVPAGCSLNVCGKNRDKNSCDSVKIGDRSNVCFYNESLSPAVCVQLRCNSLDQDSCAAASDLCFWDPNQKFKCQDRRCTHPTNELCELDGACYWNPFDSTCKVRSIHCELSDEYSAWSPWSTNCGAHAVRVRSRTILSFPSPGGDSCEERAQAQGKPITEIETKTWDGDASNCDTYCNKYANSVTQCINDISCEWKQSKCVGNAEKICASLDETDCGTSDVCTWDETMKLCVDGLSVCTQEDEQSCAAQGDCTWRTGANANAYAKSHTTYALLVKPNQKPVMVFPVLNSIDNNDTIDGATVTVETNYQRGKDKLAVAFPGKYIQWEFMPSSGTLFLSSSTPVSVAEYINAIRTVTFETSSTRGGNARTITWALGSSTVYSSETKHFYRFIDKRGMEWDEARAACKDQTRYGVAGYLATIVDDAENSLVSQKLRGVGWLSGDNNINGVWQYSSGPEERRSFWTGNSPVNGGYAAPGQYANWNTLENQPVVSENNFYHPYLNQSGYWTAEAGNMKNSHGFVCEFGGMPNDHSSVSFPTGGAVVVGVAGCLPASACGFHESETLCNADVSCTWSATQKRCLTGCGSRSTVAECDHTSSASSSCSWDTNVIPPVCDVNPCSGKATAECTKNDRCKWDKDGCTIKTGCAVYSTKDDCDMYKSCQWSGPNSEGKSECLPRTCSSLAHKDDCDKNPTCEWTEDGLCVTILCKYGLQNACQEDSRCSWNANNGASVAFTASGGRVLVFENNSVPTDFTSRITGFSVAITEGFQSGADVLVLDPPDTTQTYLANYNPVKGVLFVRIAPGASSNPNDAFNFMKRRLKFYTSSGSKTRRIISYNMNGTSIYSDISKSYFTMVKANAKTYEEAEKVCQGLTFANVTGGHRLAKILSQADNLRLATLGAYGWIGAKSDGEKWSWSDGTAFWEGAAALGKPTPATAYAQWAVGEPKTGGKYAIMTQTGQWKAVDKMELGSPVICEVIPTATTSYIHGKKSVEAVGCFVKPCVGMSRVQCITQPECVYSDDACRIDDFCSAGKNITSCNVRERCYWDYTMGACRSTPAVFCSVSNFEVTCAESSQCQWYPELLRRDSGGAEKGACGLRGCAINPTRDSCLADAKCRWDQPAGRGDGDCVERLCGYQTTKQCWADPLCEYDYNLARCTKSSCVGKSSSECTGECHMRDDVCAKRKCSSTLKGVCHQDPECLFLDGSCSDPGCTALTTNQSCSSNKNCIFMYHPIRCAAAQCITHEDKETCEVIKGGSAQCRWEPSSKSCRELTWLERNAPSVAASCEKEVTPNLWWLWLLLAIIVIILGVIIWRLYLAYAKGLNFFEPTRRNVKYSPHQQYAADLFEDAAQRTGETNDVGRPSLTDL